MSYKFADDVPEHRLRECAEALLGLGEFSDECAIPPDLTFDSEEAAMAFAEKVIDLAAEMWEHKQ
jgi:hypothetical protein